MTVPPHIQYLRCLANYKALRFSHHILELAKKIGGRMIRKSRKTEGQYVAIHLRFEEVHMLTLDTHKSLLRLLQNLI